jgi:NAD(P)-dependent dehydrogenase (short-subunit alcohol dehydrogenase family)
MDQWRGGDDHPGMAGSESRRNLQGAGAIVTGGGSGIGAATVELLVEGGATVLIVDRDLAAGEALSIRTGQPFAGADVSVAADWHRVVAEAGARLPSLDLMFLNAGVNSGRQGAPLEALADSRLTETLLVNLGGVVLGVRETLPLLAVSGGGSILATASLAAIMPFPADPVYAATKHGVVGFVRSVARQLGRRGISINVLCPTATDTPMVNDADRAWLARAGVALVSSRVIAEAAVECLLSPGTGQVFKCVDDTGAHLVTYLPQMED